MNYSLSLYFTLSLQISNLHYVFIVDTKPVPNHHLWERLLRVEGDFCCGKISRTSSTHLALFFSHSALSFKFNYTCVPEPAVARAANDARYDLNMIINKITTEEKPYSHG